MRGVSSWARARLPRRVLKSTNASSRAGASEEADMSRLEQAIKRARLPTHMDGDAIVIDRSVFPSRKTGKLCEVTLTEGEYRGGGKGGNGIHSKELSVEAKFWKQKYETLKRERNEEEEDLEHLIEVTAEREAKLIELARLLERKIDLLATTSVNGEGSAEAAEKYAKVETQRKVLQMYELCSAMTVAESEENENEYLCTVKNKMKRLVTRFSVTMPSDDEDEMLFTPLANVDLLPQYLRNAVKCDVSALPAMIKTILEELFKPDEDEDEQEEEEEDDDEE